MKVGDYVRYRCAYDNTIKIKKINAIVPPDNLINENYYKFDDYEGTIEKCIIKSSPNIIDLIEVGDFITYRQGNIYWNVPERVSGRYNRQNEQTNLIANGTPLEHLEILTIVTREQFESMEYKVN